LGGCVGESAFRQFNGNPIEMLYCGGGRHPNRKVGVTDSDFDDISTAAYMAS